MTRVSPKKNHDRVRVNEISEKLMENPELASLISEVSTFAGDASELVKGLLAGIDQCWSAGTDGCAFGL